MWFFVPVSVTAVGAFVVGAVIAHIVHEVNE